MDVRVGVKVANKPTNARFRDMRIAAVKLTNDEESISIVDQPDDEGYELIAAFEIPTSAQYKVVDEIARIFKMAIWDFEDYRTMTISFPKR